MSELNTQNILTYLQQVVAAESNIYRQEQAVSTARRSLVLREPQMEEVKKPKENRPKEPVMPKAPISRTKAKVISIFIAILYLSFFAMFIAFGNIGLAIAEGAFGVVCIAMAVRVFSVDKRAQQAYVDEKEAYQVAIKQYRLDCERYEQNHQQRLREYDEKVAYARKKHESDKLAAIAQYRLAENTISEMDEVLQQSKSVLEKLYALDHIFPKYRNFVAMCTIYEYFATGRCSELTGAAGAYNLYEAELRQNMIIDKLDTIITQLDVIAKNQYTLYAELKKTNSILNDISSDVKGILQNTDQIAKHSHITALCAEITAKNTEALKYIALVNG